MHSTRSSKSRRFQWHKLKKLGAIDFEKEIATFEFIRNKYPAKKEIRNLGVDLPMAHSSGQSND